MSSLDDVQDGFDSLMRAVFEAVHYRGAQSDSKLMSAEVTNQLESICKTIDNLKGANRTPEDQELEINSLSERQNDTIQQIEELERSLCELEAKCDVELNELLSTSTSDVKGLGH
mmetsp:Transcript_10082/g.15276  ORF Transcript_10082/g.15276 Transcript_10082/m.15276 type:complete len:115 (-) Transcript_10082:110-454(-)